MKGQTPPKDLYEAAKIMAFNPDLNDTSAAISMDLIEAMLHVKLLVSHLLQVKTPPETGVIKNAIKFVIDREGDDGRKAMDSPEGPEPSRAIQFLQIGRTADDKYVMLGMPELNAFLPMEIPAALKFVKQLTDTIKAMNQPSKIVRATSIPKFEQSDAPKHRMRLLKPW